MGKRGGASGKSAGGGAKKFQEVTDDSIFDKSVKEWRGAITTKEDNAVYEYTGDLYDPLNGALRGIKGYGDPSSFDTEIQELDSALSKFNLTRNISVYRGVSSAAFGGGDIPEVGTILQDKGYMSTTVKKSVAATFDKGYILKINVPKGKGRGAYVRSISQYSNEHEFLMKRSSKLKVTGTAPGDKEGFMGGQTVIYADLV